MNKIPDFEIIEIKDILSHMYPNDKIIYIGNIIHKSYVFLKGDIINDYRINLYNNINDYDDIIYFTIK